MRKKQVERFTARAGSPDKKWSSPEF